MSAAAQNPKPAPRAEWLDGLVRALERRLLRYAERFVSRQVAREIVQDSFVRLWDQGEAATRGHEREWLFRVCRNLAIDHLRREKRVKLLEDEGVVVPETEELLGRREEATQLQACVSQLKPSQREVIRLKYQEGMSYQEISRVTGHSVSYVGVLIHQAVEKMRQELGGGGAPGAEQKGKASG